MRQIHGIGTLAMVIALLAPAGAQAGGSERLYGVRQKIGVGRFLERLDTTSGAPLWSKPLSAQYSFGPTGLTWNGSRLLAVNNLPIADHTVTIHPADAACTTVGPTGLDIVMQSVAWDPQTGVTYLSVLSATARALYTLDPLTGAATLVAPFSGFLVPGDGFTAIAIDAAGIAIGTAGELQGQINSVYRIDLLTAQVILIGQVQGIGDGWFQDLAIDSNGEVWASFYDAGLNTAARGLYKLDASNGYAPTFVRALNPTYTGLAFAPAPMQMIYCNSTQNSVGCAPTISSDGWPSPTAHSGFALRCDSVLNQSVGVLFFTAAGRAAIPFHGGTSCLASPMRHAPLQTSGGAAVGSNDCSGVWTLDFDTYLLAHAPLPAGLMLQCQWIGRDRGFAPPNNYQLSNALEFTLMP